MAKVVMQGYFPILFAANVAVDVQILEAKLIRVHQPTMNSKDNPQFEKHARHGGHAKNGNTSAPKTCKPRWATSSAKVQEATRDFTPSSRIGYAMCQGLIWPDLRSVMDKEGLDQHPI